MATIRAKSTGGKWAETGTWEGGAVPTAADDVFLEAGAGNVTIGAEALCRSLNCTGYTGTFKHEAFALKIGEAAANGEAIALKFVAGMTYTPTGAGSKITLLSTSSTEQTVDFAGKTTKSLTFEGTGAKWKFEGTLTVEGALFLTKGALNLNGKAVTAEKVESSNSNTRTFNIENSTITLTGTGEPWKFGTVSGLTFSATGSTIKLTDATSSEKKFIGGGLTYGTLEVTGGGAGVVVIGEATAQTFAKIKINKPKTVKFGKEKTQTVTEWEATGSAGELITIESTESGKPWTLKKTSGTLISDFLKLKDSHAEGGATFYAGSHSENVSGNEGWKFEDKPSESTGPPIGSLGMMGVGR